MIARKLLILSLFALSASAWPFGGGEEDERDLVSARRCSFQEMVAKAFFKTDVYVDTSKNCLLPDLVEMGDMIVEQFVLAEVEMPFAIDEDATLPADGADSSSSTTVCAQPSLGGAFDNGGSESERSLARFSYNFRWRGGTSCGYGCPRGNNDRARRLGDSTRRLADGSESALKDRQDAEIEVYKATLDEAKVQKDNAKATLADEQARLAVEQAEEMVALDETYIDLWLEFEHDCPFDDEPSCKVKSKNLTEGKKDAVEKLEKKFEKLMDKCEKKLDTAEKTFNKIKKEMEKAIKDVKDGNKLTLDELKEQNKAKDILYKLILKYEALVEKGINKELKDLFSYCFDDGVDPEADIVFTRVGSYEEAMASIDQCEGLIEY